MRSPIFLLARQYFDLSAKKNYGNVIQQKHFPLTIEAKSSLTERFVPQWDNLFMEPVDDPPLEIS